MAKTEHVKVEAFVPPGTSVVLIEAPILRRLQAENKVLRELVDYMDRELEYWEADRYFTIFDAASHEGWEKSYKFEARVADLILNSE